MMDQIWRFWVGSKSKVEPLVYLVSNHFSLIGESHVKLIPQTIFKQLRFKLCWLFEIFIWNINKLKINENILANRFKQKSWKGFLISDIKWPQLTSKYRCLKHRDQLLHFNPQYVGISNSKWCKLNLSKFSGF